MKQISIVIKYISLCVVIMLSAASQAIVDGHEYKFEDSSAIENQTRAQLFKQLAEELRCPKCQNQNLSDSNAMIAGDLRRELYSQVKAGKNADEIVDFMVNRYGEFVLYRPALNTRTMVLWYGPIALLVLAILIFLVIILKRRSRSTKDSPLEESMITAEADEKISDDEQQRLAQLLGDDPVVAKSKKDSKEGDK